MVTLAVIPRYRVPQGEICGVVPTESTGGKLTSSISRVPCTHWLWLSQTSSVIWWTPSDKQATARLAVNHEPLPPEGWPHAASRSPSMLLLQL